jgi:alpha-amylase/alpha-mannosidase (GH57 family)
MERYICIHGHFYQPPRENAWLEAVELQDSAYPYHDWNERITAESYGPNTSSRLLDAEGKICRIVNNYSRISFNFGPTLLAWLEEKAPDVYQGVLDADRESQKFFSGHGSAIAQAYNHMILPLANWRDKYTQVFWGIRDFENRFGRPPEGMWLPETAVDIDSLDIMASLGIRFTILSPYQARRVRRFRGRNWAEVGGGKIDPSQAYEIRLPSGFKINLFFYDGPISQAVAFEHLLSNGEHFARRLSGAFDDSRNRAQLVHIATDGETYGHHQAHGDMALTYALHFIESQNLARLTNYGAYLEKHPPGHEVEIFENSAWSCSHGVDRWKIHCGCNSGMNPGWNQNWRFPLREALDWLRDTLAPLFKAKGGEFLKDPWEARDEYIKVILDRSPENRERFLGKHQRRELTKEEKIFVFKLLELQRHTLLMYTSCGWFFDEPSGIETVQVIQYAGRAIQLAQELFGDDLETKFLDRLERAKSNIPEHGDGRRVYEKLVKPAMVDLRNVAAHYAIRSLFRPYEEHDRIYCYTADREDYQSAETGKMRLGMGRARFTSRITQEAALMTFGVLHLGDHNINGGVRDFRGAEAYQKLVLEVKEVFSRADLPEVIRVLDKGFGKDIFSFRSLFRDEQRRILDQILKATLSQAEAVYQQLFENQAPLIHFLLDEGIPLPKSLETAAEFALNTSLRKILEAQPFDRERFSLLLEQAKRLRIPLDHAGLGYKMKERIERVADRFRHQPRDFSLLRDLDSAIAVALSLPFEVDFWKVQNTLFDVWKREYPHVQAQRDTEDQTWNELFKALGEKLSCCPGGREENGEKA